MKTSDYPLGSEMFQNFYRKAKQTFINTKQIFLMKMKTDYEKHAWKSYEEQLIFRSTMAHLSYTINYTL